MQLDHELIRASNSVNSILRHRIFFFFFFYVSNVWKFTLANQAKRRQWTNWRVNTYFLSFFLFFKTCQSGRTGGGANEKRASGNKRQHASFPIISALQKRTVPRMCNQSSKFHLYGLSECHVRQKVSGAGGGRRSLPERPAAWTAVVAE